MQSGIGVLCRHRTFGRKNQMPARNEETDEHRGPELKECVTCLCAFTRPSPAAIPMSGSALRGLETARERMDYLGWAVRESHRAMGDLAKECQTGAFAHRIFMAPEYYFANRRYENDRFFSHDLKRWIIGKLYKLGDLYPNLLIIYGTVLWTKSLRQEKVAKLEDNVAWAKGVGVQTMSEGASHTPARERSLLGRLGRRAAQGQLGQAPRDENPHCTEHCLYMPD